MQIIDFQKKIGYLFKNPQLLQAAFTHSSYANENGTQSYERLEFLGDAILDFIIGEYLFTNYPDMKEGTMSRVRASLVCEKALYDLAIKLDIGDYMLLGVGAENSGERNRVSILSDMFEAHIAAMYIDAGFEKTRDYVISIYGDIIDYAASGKTLDYKTTLQEKLQKNGPCEILYKQISAKGPVHRCLFTVQVVADGKVLGEGCAYSKKEAQQIAAKDALSKI